MSGRPNLAGILRGVAQLARGRADGIRQFGESREAFLASLAPLVAFPLVGGILMLLSGGGADALSDLLMTVCALLAPPVLSFEAARLWGREAAWLRFATAFNWCQWAIPVVGSLLLLALGMLTSVGLPRQAAQMLAVVGLASYGLWLHWFLARHGLGLSRTRAALLVFGVNLATVAIVVVPRILALAGEGGK
ncbi:MAG: hypothetical protein ACHQIO_17070 [Nevskiales bacterium]